MLHSFVDGTTEKAIQISKKPFCDYLRSHISLINKAEFVTNDINLNSEEHLDQIIELAFKKYSEHSALIGDENKCIKLITKLKRIGVDEIACFIDFGIEDDIILEKLKYLNNLKIRSESLIDIENTTLIQHLKQTLPAYMVPSIFLYHTNFRYTHNGKLDQKWLDKEAHKIINSYNLKLSEKSQYIPPSNKMEGDIAKLWSEILDIPQASIAIDSDFFKLGGHSILTIKLVNSIHKTFNIKISVAEVFDNRTLEQQAQLLINKDVIKTTSFDNSNKIADTLIPLSFGQERLWFIDQYEQGASVCNVPLVYSLREDTDPVILAHSLQDIIMRHQVLRSVIKTSQEGELYLSVDTNNVAIDFVEKSLKNQAELEDELYKEGNQIFQLNQSYPIRAILYSVPHDMSGKMSMYLLIVIHHIAFDGWSLDIFEKELEEFYKNNLLARNGNKTNLSLPNLEQQYGDFAQWQRKYVMEEVMESHMDFWQRKLDNLPDFTLAIANARPKFLNYEGDNIWFDFDDYSSQIIRDFAHKSDFSLFSILLSAFYMLLYKHSGEKDIISGIPVANRHYPHVENLIGFFVNTLPVRVKFDTDTSVINFIKVVSNEIIEAQKYQDLPFDKLVSGLKLTKNINKHPIFQIMFENITLSSKNDGALDNNDNKFFQHYTPKQHIQKLAKFDLNFFIDLNHKQLRGYCNYASMLFEKESIIKIIEDYKEIILAIALSLANDHDIPFTNLPIFSDRVVRN
jgi:acyl carrier protein